MINGLQDTLTPVRAAFATKLVQLTACLHLQSGGARKAAKYAAVLALGAMDPVEQNQKAAFVALQDFVTSRRLLLQRAGGGPVQDGSGPRQIGGSLVAGTSFSNASMLHETPEFILPYAVQARLHTCYYIHILSTAWSRWIWNTQSSPFSVHIYTQHDNTKSLQNHLMFSAYDPISTNISFWMSVNTLSSIIWLNSNRTRLRSKTCDQKSSEHWPGTLELVCMYIWI